MHSELLFFLLARIIVVSTALHVLLRFSMAAGGDRTVKQAMRIVVGARDVRPRNRMGRALEVRAAVPLRDRRRPLKHQQSLRELTGLCIATFLSPGLVEKAPERLVNGTIQISPATISSTHPDETTAGRAIGPEILATRSIARHHEH